MQPAPHTLEDILPIGGDSKASKARSELFRKIDSNNNKHVALDEVLKVYKPLIEAAKIDNADAHITRAFNIAKSFKSKKVNAETIELNEFKLFIRNLRLYIDLSKLFNKLDTDNSKSITLQEFKDHKAELEKLIGTIANVDELFAAAAKKDDKVTFDELVEFLSSYKITFDDEHHEAHK